MLNAFKNISIIVLTLSVLIVSDTYASDREIYFIALPENPQGVIKLHISMEAHAQ